MLALGAILLTVSLSFVAAGPGTPATPATALQAAEHEAHLVCASLTRLVNNLRLVYDLSALSETDRPGAQPGASTSAAEKPLLGIDLDSATEPPPDAIYQPRPTVE
jgi:hypothetical protein